MDLETQLKNLLVEVKTMTEKAEAENRGFTPEEETAAKAKLAEIAEVKEKITKAKADNDLLDALRETIKSDEAHPEGKGSLGEQFVKSDEYKTFMKSFPSGTIGDRARVNSMPMGVKTLLTGTGDESVGSALVRPEDSGILELLGRRPLTLRSLISVRTTQSDAIDYVQQLSRENNAAMVPEAQSSKPIDGTTVTDAQGGLKPEGGFVLKKETTNVKTLAEWVPATRRALADVKQLRALIDQELKDDLKEKEEDQILSGDGTGENLTGILSTSGIQKQTYADGGSDIFLAARKAKRKVRTVGRSVPTGYLLNPEDWEKYDTAKASDGHYLGGGPFGAAQGSVWGLPVIESEAVPVGQGVCADFRKAILWDREQAQISISDSHADFFTRNLIAVLGEERVAFAVVRPSAFIQFDLK